MEIRELNKKELYTEWMKLPVIHFSKWMWEVAVRKQPNKYSMTLPTYQGQRVVMT